MNTLKLITINLFVITLSEALINVCIPFDFFKRSKKPELKQLQDEIYKELKLTNDSIFIPDIDVNVNHPAIRLKGSLSNVTISQFTNFNICLIVPNHPVDLFNLTFLQINVKGQYDINGNVGELFDVFGKGDFWIKMTNFSIAITNFNVVMNKEICMPINIKLNLLKMENYFEGLMNNEELEILFNKAISKMSNDVIRILWDELKETFDKPLEKFLNDFFHKKKTGILGLPWRSIEETVEFKTPYCLTNKDIIY